MIVKEEMRVLWNTDTTNDASRLQFVVARIRIYFFLNTDRDLDKAPYVDSLSGLSVSTS